MNDEVDNQPVDFPDQKRPDIPANSRWLFFLIMFCPVILTGKFLDNDIWFIMNTGRYILANGFPHIEPFTIHQGFNFMVQQWLSAVLFWTLYSTMGKIGLLLLVSIVYALLILAIFNLSMLVSNRFFFVSFAVTMLSTVIAYNFMVTRPYILSTLFFVVELLILEIYIEKRKSIILTLIPLISILVINLHAALWPMMIILLIPYAIDSFKFRIFNFKSHGYPVLPMLATLLATIAAGVINPYGPKAMTYLVKSLGHDEMSNFIIEMKALDINTASGKYFFALISVSLLIYLFYRKGTTRIRYFLLTAGLLYMAMSSGRNLILYASLALFPLAYYLKDWHIMSGQQDQAAKPNRLYIRWILVILILVVFISKVYSVFQPMPIDAQLKQLDTVLQDVKQQAESRPVILYTGFNDGGYAEFIGLKPYIDPRAEIFTIEINGQKDVMKEYINLQIGVLHYREFLDRYNFTHLVVTKGDILYAYLKQDPDYHQAMVDGDYYLFEKSLMVSPR